MNSSTDEFAKKAAFLEAAFNGDISTVNHILHEDSVDIEVVSRIRGKKGLTALHLASLNGHAHVVTLLLLNRANKYAVAKGRRAVHFASEGGHLNVLKVLWRNGCPIKCKTNKDSTALHIAANEGHLEVVKWLVEKGAFLQLNDRRGLTPEDRARKSGHEDVAEYLHVKTEKLKMNDLTESIKLCEGSIGEVFLVKRDGRDFVLKTINLPGMSRRDQKYAHQELKLLRSINHPNIISYVGGGFKGIFLHIQMEFCSGGTLEDRIKEQRNKKEPFHEQQIINWSYSLCLALAYVHSRNILHRDIKPDNIFMTGEDIIKLGDFGFAKELKEGDQALTFIDSPAYMSPELHQGDSFSTATDMWSFGSVMFEMAVLERAFPYVNLDMPDASEGYNKAVTSLLQWYPGDRPSAAELLNYSIFKHPSNAESGFTRSPNATYDQVIDSINISRINDEQSSGFESGSNSMSSKTPTNSIKSSNDHSNEDQPDGMLPMRAEVSKPQSISGEDSSEKGVDVNRTNEEEDLIKAALDGDIDTVNRLLDDEVNIEAISQTKGREGITPLLAASWSGEDKVVQLLLDRKANIEAEANGLSAVHYAAKGGHVSVLQVLWDAGSDMKWRTTDGSSPLHLAANNGNLETVRWLVEKGASYNIQDKKGQTPEDVAIHSGYKEVAKFLHEKQLELGLTGLDIETQLGKGAFGDVFLAKRNETLIVLKSVNLSNIQTKKKKEYALQEINLLKSLKHPYIVHYLGGGCMDDYIYIQMEYCSGGDLGKQIDEQKEKKIPFEEPQLVNWTLHLGLAMKYIHGRKILHRDIKPQNIFLTGYNVIKLGDFGVSKVMEGEFLTSTSIGSPAYMSPEVFEGKPYDSAADMWSFGCIMFELAALKVAFPHRNLEMPNFSQEYKDAVMSLLQRDPENRLTADKLLKLPIFHDALEELYITNQSKASTDSHEKD